MKRRMRIWLCLILTAAWTLAALEACAAAPGPERFAQGISAFFGTFSPEKEALELTVQTPDGETRGGTLTIGEDRVSLNLALPEGAAELQLGSEAAWLSAGGQVFEVRYEDLMRLAQPLERSNAETLKEIAGLFVQKVLLPGVSVETAESGTVIRLHYDAAKMLPSLAEFLDAVIASDEYLGAVMPLLNNVAMAQGADAIAPEELRAQWLSGREQLLALPADLSLTGQITVGGGALDGQLLLAVEGETDTIAFSGTNAPEAASFSLVLSAKGENVREGEALRLSLALDKKAKTLAGKLSLPMMQEELRVTGSITDGVLTGTATRLLAEYPLFEARLVLADGGNLRGRITGSGQLAVTTGTHRMNSRTTVVDFDFAPDRIRASVSSEGRSAFVSWSRDGEGNFEAALEYPNPYLNARLTGTAARGEVHAEGSVYGAVPAASFTLDASLPKGHFALEGSFAVSKGSVTADVSRNGAFTAQAEATIVGSSHPVPVSAKLSGILRRGRSFLLVADYELNVRGKLAGGHVSAVRKGRDRSLTATLNLFRTDKTWTLQAVSTPERRSLDVQSGADRLALQAAADGSVSALARSSREPIERALTGGFDEAGDYVLDLAWIYRMEPGPGMLKRETHSELRASAGADRLALTISVEDGTEIFASTLQKTPAQPVKPLSETTTVRLDADALRELLRQAVE